MTFSMDLASSSPWASLSVSASSTFCLSGTTAPRRKPPSAVMTSLACESLDAVGDGLRAEPAEDDRVHRADAGAGEHGNGGLRHHRQVDEDAVARLDAVALEDIGEAADLVMKLFVGEGALFARLAGGGGLALPDQRGLVGAWRCPGAGPGNCS